MKATVLSFITAAILAGAVWFPPNPGQCTNLVGHHHGHGKPIVICVGA